MALAEMHAFNYDTELQPSKDILSVYGIIYQMEGEVLLHVSKNGNSDKTKSRMDALKTVLDFLDNCNSCYSRNHQYRMMLKNSIRERDNMENKIEELNKQLSAVEKAFSEG